MRRGGKLGRLASADVRVASPRVSLDADGGISQMIDEESNVGGQSRREWGPGFTRVCPENSPH